MSNCEYLLEGEKGPLRHTGKVEKNKAKKSTNKDMARTSAVSKGARSEGVRERPRLTRKIPTVPEDRKIREFRAKVALYGTPPPGSFSHPTLRRIV